jgi:hypothetical protein
MQETVKGLVADLGCESSLIQGVDNSLKSSEADFHELDDEVNSEANTGDFGGGGQTRTVDSADMSHEDSDESC